MEFCRLVLRVWLVGGHTVQSSLAPHSSSALGILVFKECRFNDAIPPLFDSKAAAPVGTGLPSYGTGLKGVIVTTPLPFEAPTPSPTYAKVVWGLEGDTQPTRNLRQARARPPRPEPPVDT